MSYLERKHEPNGCNFTVTVTAEGFPDFEFTWTGYGDLVPMALMGACEDYSERRAEMFPDAEYDELMAQISNGADNG